MSKRRNLIFHGIDISPKTSEDLQLWSLSPQNLVLNDSFLYDVLKEPIIYYGSDLRNYKFGVEHPEQLKIFLNFASNRSA